MTNRRASTRQRTQERRAATEQAIVAALEALLSHRHFPDLSIDDVMSTTGLTRTAFYRYFPDLESVLVRSLGAVTTELEDATDAWLDPGDDPRQTLQVAARNLVDVYRQHGSLLLAISDAAANGPDVEALWRETVETFVERSTERIEELCRRGLSSLERPVETARALVWMTERYLLESYAGDGDASAEDVAAVLVHIWSRSIFD